MLQSKGYAVYANSKVQTASPAELTLMLYEAAIKFCNIAEMAIEKNDIQKAHDNIKKVEAIIEEFQATLNHKYPVAKDFDKVYTYLMQRLVEANIKKDTKILDEVLEHLRTMRDAWKEVMRVLEKKEQVLDKIIELDTVQKNQLEDPNLTPDDFDDVVEQKSKLIEQLDNLDSGFEKLFERVKEELEGNKETYKEEICIMQDHIRKITDKSVKIQSQEARNKALMTSKFNGIKKQARQVRKGANVASKYYQSMTKTGYVDPQFMDNKK